MAALAMAFPAAVMAVLILKYWVDFPYWDQWSDVHMFNDAARGHLTFHDVFVQHNESRPLFPNLLFIGLAFLTHWDTRADMLVIFLLACINCHNVYRLSRLTLAASPAAMISAMFLSSLLIFSPIQYENWLWGVQIVVFVPIVCITTSLLVAYSRLGVRWKFLLCGCLATVSTFSYANGQVCWVVVLPVLWVTCFSSRANAAQRRPCIAGWLAAFIANLLAYYHDYRKPADSPSFLYAVHHGGEAAVYFLSLIGAPLGMGSASAPLTLDALHAGLIVLTLAVAVWGTCFTLRRDREFLHRSAGWLALSAAVAISGVTATLGRVALGVDQARSSRYTTFSSCLIIALIFLLALLLPYLRRRGEYIGGMAAGITVCLGAIFLLSYISVVRAGVGFMHQWQQNNLQGKAALEFINISPSEALTRLVFPKLPALTERADEMDQLGFLTPPLIKTARVQDFAGGPGDYGAFALTRETGGNQVATGWAILPQRRRPADAVLISYERAPGDDEVLQLVTPGVAAAAPDASSLMADAGERAVTATGNVRYAAAAWQAEIGRGRLPRGATRLRAWAYDCQIERAYPLGGPQTF